MTAARVALWHSTLLPCPTWCDGDHCLDNPLDGYRYHWGAARALTSDADAGGGGHTDDDYALYGQVFRLDHHEPGRLPRAEAPRLRLDGPVGADCTPAMLREMAAWLQERADELERLDGKGALESLPDVAAALSAEIRAEMARQDTTTSVLAAAAGISARRLNLRLTDRAPFDLRDLEDVGGVLGISVLELLRRAEARASSSS